MKWSKILILLTLMSCSQLKTPKREIASETTVLKRPFSVLVWNVYKGSRGSEFTRDAQLLMPDKDLLLLQEVLDNQDFHDLYQSLPALHYEHSQSWGEHGVATLSSAAPLEAAPIRSNVREAYFTTPKASLFTYYALPSARLLVLNVHMINFHEIGAVRSKLEQFREALEEHQGPVLAAGDFNTWSHARVSLVRQFFEEFGLREVHYAPSEAEDPRRKRIVGVLDRVYIRGLKVLSKTVHQQIESSDHYPFELTLDLED